MDLDFYLDLRICRAWFWFYIYGIPRKKSLRFKEVLNRPFCPCSIALIVKWICWGYFSLSASKRAYIRNILNMLHGFTYNGYEPTSPLFVIIFQLAVCFYTYKKIQKLLIQKILVAAPLIYGLLSVDCLTAYLLPVLISLLFQFLPF